MADNTVTTNGHFQPHLGQWRVAWSTEVGRGYSAVTTFENRAYTNGHDEQSNETIVCLDISSGDTLWTYSYEAALMPRAHGGGPNASIAVDGDRVFAVSKDGQLFCLDSRSGKPVWKTRLTELLNMEVPSWGFGGSPLISGEQLIVGAGRVLTMNKADGSVIWISKTQRNASYGTPVIFRQHGESYVAAMDGNGYSILRAKSGEELLHKRITTKNNVVSNTPHVFANGKRIFIHTNAFSEVIEFDGEKIEVVWNDRKLQNSQSASIIVDGVLYGLNGLPENRRTKLYARDPATGEVFWSKPNFGFGSLIAIDDKLLILTDKGELITVEANHNSYQEISRRKILEPTCWTKPTYIPGRIFARNDAGQLVCLVQN